MKWINSYYYSRMYFAGPVICLLLGLTACGGGGGGGGEGTPSPAAVTPIVEVEETVVPTRPTEIKLTHFALKSNSDTRPEDDIIEIQTTWNQGAFTFEFSAEAYDASTESTRYEFILSIGKDTTTDLDDYEYFRSGSCDTNDIHIGYECDDIEVQYCRLYPQNSYYVGSCRNRFGQIESGGLFVDLISELPQPLNAMFEVCHINNDTGYPVRECVVQLTPITIY